MLEGFHSPPSLESFDKMFDDMMGRSLKMFDTMLAMDGITSSVVQQPVKEEKTLVTEADNTKKQQAEQAAEQALDFMVTSLFSHPLNDDVKKQDMTDALTRRGEHLLTHRRLSESSPADPHHAAVEQRLARRLTEYSVDLYFQPGGGVVLYSSSINPPIVAADKQPVLGMGSDYDSCIYSQYNNADLNGKCKRAMDMFFTAKNTPGLMYEQVNRGEERNILDQKAFDTIAKVLEENAHETDSQLAADAYYASLGFLMVIYAIIAFVGLCTGIVDMWTFVAGIMASITVASCGFGSLILLLPWLLLVGHLLPSHEDDDEEEERKDEVDGFDYVKLPGDDENTDSAQENVVKQAETHVYVGVPVQVV